MAIDDRQWSRLADALKAEAWRAFRADGLRVVVEHASQKQRRRIKRWHMYADAAVGASDVGWVHWSMWGAVTRGTSLDAASAGGDALPPGVFIPPRKPLPPMVVEVSGEEISPGACCDWRGGVL